MSVVTTVVVLGAVFAGYVIGGFILKGVKKLESTQFMGQDLYTFLATTFYFGCVFSAPVSGNIPLFIITLGLFLYSLHGGFGIHKLEPLKKEDSVRTKWYPGYP